MAKWEHIPPNNDAARFHPNLDFWKVGHKLIAGTEAPYWVGYEFDVKNLNSFKLFPFTEENEIFGHPKASMIPISMAIHERMDLDEKNLLWGSFSAMNFNERKFYQVNTRININFMVIFYSGYFHGRQTWSSSCGRNVRLW